MIGQKREGGLSDARTRSQLAVFLLPPLAALVFLFVLPISLMIVYSFWTVDNNYQLVRSPSLVNYAPHRFGFALCRDPSGLGLDGTADDGFLRRAGAAARLVHRPAGAPRAGACCSSWC